MHEEITSMEEKVLTFADIGVATLRIGYNEDRSKAVIEINRVDKDRETLSKLETLKDKFKFRPTGQKSVYEIEEIETNEHFYRLFCTRVEDDDAPKVSAEHNDDGSVTFSVPTVQGLRIREDAVPVFVSHGDEPGERGEQGGVDDILMLTDKVDVLGVNPLGFYTKEIELKCNDKFGLFVESWQSLPVPRKIIFRMEKDSQDLYQVESFRYECGRGFITAQYIGNMCNLNPLSIEDKIKDLRSRIGLDYKSPLEREKELISKLQTGMLTYTDVADDGSKDGNAFTLCRGGRGNGKPIFDPSNPEHRSMIMQGLRELMMLIEDKFPQLHRARLNKPKSI